MDRLRNLLRTLDGKKTYLGIIAGGILGLIWSCGLVTDETAKVIASIIAAWTGVSLRHAIQKAELPPLKDATSLDSARNWRP
jgi:hypothetical protein